MISKMMYGVISEVDVDQMTARVNFEQDDLVSNWLQIIVPRSSGDQVTFPLDVNEHVCCLMDEHLESGVILGAIYDQSNKPRKANKGSLILSFADNSSIEYNRESANLTLDIKKEIVLKCESAKIDAAVSIDINAPEVNITGALMVKGAATITGVVGMGGLSGLEGGAIEGAETELNVKSLSATEDIKVDNISFKRHTHTAPPGGGATGPPIP